MCVLYIMHLWCDTKWYKQIVVTWCIMMYQYNYLYQINTCIPRDYPVNGPELAICGHLSSLSTSVTLQPSIILQTADLPFTIQAVHGRLNPGGLCHPSYLRLAMLGIDADSPAGNVWSFGHSPKPLSHLLQWRQPVRNMLFPPLHLWSSIIIHICFYVCICTISIISISQKTLQHWCW